MSNTAKTIFGWGCVLAIAGILLGSWAPFHPRATRFDEVLRGFMAALSSPSYSRGDTVANVLIGIPLGYLLTGCLVVGRKASWVMRGGATCAVFAAVITQGLVCELGQGWIVDRVASARDVVAQSTGGLIGISAWWMTGRIAQRAINRMFGGRQLWMRVETAIAVAAVGVLVWSIMPFDVLVSPAELAKKWSKGGIEWMPFFHPGRSGLEWIYQAVLGTLITIPLGLWVARSLLPRVTSRNTFGDLLLAAICTGVLPELLQIPIAGRIASSTDAFFGVIGAGIGIWVSRMIWQTAERPNADLNARLIKLPSTWFIAALGFWIALCLVSWFPFEFHSEPKTIRELLRSVWQDPFTDYRGSNLRSLFVFFRQAVMSAVFGGMLGVGTSLIDSAVIRRSMLAMVVVAIGSLSFLLELGQLLEKSHSGAGLGLTIRIVGGMLGVAVAYAIVRGTRRRPVAATQP